jgi:nitrate/nitrite transport system permease protein
MSIQTIEDTTVKAFPAKPAEVIAFTAKARRRFDPMVIAGKLASALVPPAIVIALMLVVWQIACSSPTASLPPPSQVWNEAYDLIAHPFFNNGPQDIGLAWRVLISLQRVAIGFGLAAIVGVALGALVGQSIWAMRGLDPVFQILRNIPQDYRNVARILRLNQFEFFVKIMVPAAAPYIFTGLRIGIGLSWLAIVAAEMLTGGVGIGFFIWDAWNSSRLPDIIVALAYIGVTGFCLDRLVAAVGAFVTRGTTAK